MHTTVIRTQGEADMKRIREHVLPRLEGHEHRVVDAASHSGSMRPENADRLGAALAAALADALDRIAELERQLAPVEAVEEAAARLELVAPKE